MRGPAGSPNSQTQSAPNSPGRASPAHSSSSPGKSIVGPVSPDFSSAGSPGPGEQPLVDYSHAFMKKLGDRIRELFSLVVPPEGEEDGWMLSRMDVFAWMAGFDLQKVLAEDDMDAALKRECQKPRCILSDFGVTDDGRLTLGAAGIPALALNLGIDWELQQITVDDVDVD